MRRLVPLVFVAALVIALVAGCKAAAPAVDHPAAETVQRLLELRRDDVRDPEAYAPFFLDSELATALAEGSGEPTGTPRVPEWEAPYVSEESSESVSVAVVWKADPDFEGWPAVNVFLLSLTDGRWIVVDALEATAAPAPLRPAKTGEK
jgi:hypothetical protein